MNEFAEDGRLIVGFLDQSGTNTVDDRTDDASVGDIVKVEIPAVGDDRAVEVIKRDGWDRGNSVAVVEAVLDEKLVVRSQDGQMEVDRPEMAVEEGYTVSLTPANSFGEVLDTEPIEIEPRPELEIDALNLNLGSDEDEERDEASEASVFQPENTGDVSFDDVVGLHTAKERLIEAVQLPLEKEDKMAEFDLEGQFGILFYGPPGTGKTMLAKAAANEWGSSDLFFHIGGPEIVNKYYGESERQIRGIFAAAEEAAEEAGKPAFVFIDELDSVVPRRDRADHTERRIVAQFLSQLDGLEDRGNIVVIGATNLIEVIDPAVRRPGRFDEEIEFSLPNKDERVAILDVHSQDMPLSPTVDFEQIADQTRGWSGADLESIVKKAGFIAVKEDRSAVHHEDFVIALERYDEQRETKRKQLNEVREQQ